MRFSRLAIIVINLCILTETPACADYFYSFTNVNDIGFVGGTNTVNVFLNWDGVGTNHFLSPFGLTSAYTGIRLVTTSVGAVTVTDPPVMGVDVIAGAFPTNSAAGPGDFIPWATHVNLAGINATSGSPVLSPGGDPTRILVGSFRLIGTTPGSVTISAYLLQPGPGFNVTGNGIGDLDPLVVEGFSTFNVVPEPGTLVLCGVGGLLFGGIAVRKRMRGRRIQAPEVLLA